MTTNESTAAQDHGLLLKLIASLTLADHLGDVVDDVRKVLQLAEIEIEWDSWEELAEALAERGITTLYGTSLARDEDEEDEDAD
jgi:hypothetical protein